MFVVKGVQISVHRGAWNRGWIKIINAPGLTSPSGNQMRSPEKKIGDVPGGTSPIFDLGGLSHDEALFRASLFGREAQCIGARSQRSGQRQMHPLALHEFTLFAVNQTPG